MLIFEEADVKGEEEARAAESDTAKSKRLALKACMEAEALKAEQLMKTAVSAQIQALRAKRASREAENELNRSINAYASVLKQKRTPDIAGLVEEMMAAKAPALKKLKVK